MRRDIQEMAKFGNMLVLHGLVESHFGNISIRRGSKILITRSSSPLDGITEKSVVEVDIDKPSSPDAIASSELPVHKAIYQYTLALAIIHAHPPFAVIESLLAQENIIPIDIEGQYFLHQIPVVGGVAGTSELAKNTREALKDHKGVVVSGHGTFAVGKTLEEAYFITAQVEHSCRLKYYFDLAKK